MSLPRWYPIAAPMLTSIMRGVARWVLPKLRERIEHAALQRSSIPARTPSRRRVLVHAASMGELEQCVPIIDALVAQDSSLEIIVSCSSPSGMRHALTLRQCTAAVYHPFESATDVVSFLDIVRPDAVVIDRYDVWPLFVDELHRRAIPITLINATFPSAARSILLRSVIATTYSQLSQITAVTSDDARLLSEFTGRSITVLPDSRVDRILQRVASARETFEHLQRSTPTLIVGSSWDADIDILMPAISDLDAQTLRVIIVPHEPSEATLSNIESTLPCTRLSRATSSTEGHIVVDSVGALLSLYALASAAYVGGGFGAGVHSVLEPAGYGIPLACGPRIERSRDAADLLAAGACTVVSTPEQVKQWMNDVVLNAQERQRIGRIAQSYVASRSGSSQRYAHEIYRIISEQSPAA